MSIVIALLVNESESLAVPAAPVPDPPDIASVKAGLILSTAPATFPDLLVLPAKSDTLSISSTFGVSAESRSEGNVR
jgi:hypothetical protein